MQATAEVLGPKNLVPLAQAVQFFPASARPAYKSLTRWVTTGVRGVKLRAQLIGGRWWTTRAAVEAFLAALNGDCPPI
jgi:hypothetical protein